MSKRNHCEVQAILALTAILFALLGTAGCRAIDSVRQRLRRSPTPSPTVVRVEPTPTVLAEPVFPTPTQAVSPASLVSVGSPTPVPQTVTPELRAPTATTAAPSVASPISPTPAVSVTPVTSLPVRIAIPDLGIDVPVVEMGWKVIETADGPRSEWDLEVIKDAAGHHIDSAPLGGPGNVVISGHNNIYGRVFQAISLAWGGNITRLDEVTERSDALDGRLVYLYDAANRQFTYRITDFYRLKDTGVSPAQRVANARFMRPTADTRLTLVTCWPPWSNTHRLIVVAKPVEQP